MWINDLLSYANMNPGSVRKPGEAFVTLVDHTACVFWLFFLLTGFALFLLRNTDHGLARPFSVPWYPWLPIIFCCTSGFMFYSSTTYVGWRSCLPWDLFSLVSRSTGWLACSAAIAATP